MHQTEPWDCYYYGCSGKSNLAEANRQILQGKSPRPITPALTVTPAEAGASLVCVEMPAFAGMTGVALA